MYPAEGIAGYPREQFIDDLLGQHETEIRSCLAKGAHKVQIDFTEGRLAVKTGSGSARFIAPNHCKSREGRSSRSLAYSRSLR